METSEPVAADRSRRYRAAETTVASETDLDADNYADALELEVGLDPTNPDTDGDGVADGDEVTIYFTDPYTADPDGDGLVDGEELFATRPIPSSGTRTVTVSGMERQSSSDAGSAIRAPSERSLIGQLPRRI